MLDTDKMDISACAWSGAPSRFNGVPIGPSVAKLLLSYYLLHGEGGTAAGWLVCCGVSGFARGSRQNKSLTKTIRADLPAGKKRILELSYHNILPPHKEGGVLIFHFCSRHFLTLRKQRSIP